MICAYVNRQTSVIHSNEGGGKLCYVSISAQKSVYATQSCSTSFPVSTDPGGTVTYPSRNIMAAVLSATTRANEENIRIWKEYDNVMRSSKQVIFNHFPDTYYRTLKYKYTGYVNSTYLDIHNHLIE